MSEQENVKELFTRSPRNPIFTPSDLPYPAKFVCNPAATEIGDDTLLLLRVTDSQDRSHLYVARSPDGVGDWRFDPQPLLSPDIAPAWYDDQGCEDPRITWVPERGEYVIAYVGASRYGAGVCLATTRDFQDVRRMGLIIHPYNKDAALFPRKIRGRYLLLHRPTAGPLENIWLSQSGGEDMRDWGQPCCVLEECDQPGWDSGKVGTGPPPIETPEGWLLIFHGVQQVEKGWIYRVGLALLDKDEPSRVIARTPHWIMEPSTPYEQDGFRPGIIFPTGAIVRDGVVSLYYGAADTSVALATAPLDALLETLRAYRN